MSNAHIVHMAAIESTVVCAVCTQLSSPPVWKWPGQARGYVPAESPRPCLIPPPTIVRWPAPLDS